MARLLKHVGDEPDHDDNNCDAEGADVDDDNQYIVNTMLISSDDDDDDHDADDNACYSSGGAVMLGMMCNRLMQCATT